MLYYIILYYTILYYIIFILYYIIYYILYIIYYIIYYIILYYYIYIYILYYIIYTLIYIHRSGLYLQEYFCGRRTRLPSAFRICDCNDPGQTASSWTALRPILMEAWWKWSKWASTTWPAPATTSLGVVIGSLSKTGWWFQTARPLSNTNAIKVARNWKRRKSWFQTCFIYKHRNGMMIPNGRDFFCGWKLKHQADLQISLRISATGPIRRSSSSQESSWSTMKASSLA